MEKIIPLEEVWEDMGSDDGMVANAAFDYYIQHYASEEIRLKNELRRTPLRRKIFNWYYKNFMKK